MVDEKVYKTDYESEFTTFIKHYSACNGSQSEAVKLERDTYTVLNNLRDNPDNPQSRNKLWEDF